MLCSRGEPGNWPIVSSSFGQFDLAGFAKSSSYWYRAQWLAAVNSSDTGRPVLPSQHVVRVSQSWERPPWQNETIDSLVVFSDLPLIEVFVNNRSLGEVACDFLGYAQFTNVKYEPGNLTAVARASHLGENLATHTQLTAGAPHQLILTLDAPSVATGTGSALLLDGHDAALVRATVVDENGITVDSNITIGFNVIKGPGRVIGVHNGNASSHEPQTSSTRMAYHGLARAVVKVTVDAASENMELQKRIHVVCGEDCSTHIGLPTDSSAVETGIVVTADAVGLPTANITIPVSVNARAHSVLATAAIAARAGTALSFH